MRAYFTANVRLLRTYCIVILHFYDIFHIQTYNQPYLGRSMLWVCFLGVIFLYIYALLGFLFLRNIYTGNNLYCGSLWECFVSTIRNGLMLGMADVSYCYLFVYYLLLL